MDELHVILVLLICLTLILAVYLRLKNNLYQFRQNALEQLIDNSLEMNSITSDYIEWVYARDTEDF